MLADRLLHYEKCQMCNNEAFSHVETQAWPFSKYKNIFLDTQFQNSDSSAITAGGEKYNILFCLEHGTDDGHPIGV